MHETQVEREPLWLAPLQPPETAVSRIDQVIGFMLDDRAWNLQH